MKNFYHGGSYSKLYNVWINMRKRCSNPNNPRYKDYGGRGIEVCREWSGRNSFSVFQKWALNNGYEDGLTLERSDNDGPYSPENCKWVTSFVNSQNTRRVILITFENETKSIGEWSRDPRCIVTSGTLAKRLRSGWKPEKAITKKSERQ